jgi:hypothetical protein
MVTHNNYIVMSVLPRILEVVDLPHKRLLNSLDGNVHQNKPREGHHAHAGCREPSRF